MIRSYIRIDYTNFIQTGFIQKLVSILCNKSVIRIFYYGFSFWDILIESFLDMKWDVNSGKA